MIRVKNVNDAPVVDGFAPTTAGAGYPVQIDARFTDVDGEEDQHTVSIDWGDGQSETEGTPAQDASYAGPLLFEDSMSNGDVTALHSYSVSNGSFTPRVCITDNVMQINGNKIPTATSLVSCIDLGPVSVSPMADIFTSIDIKSTTEPGDEFEYIVNLGNKDNDFNLGRAAENIDLTHQVTGPMVLTSVIPNEGLQCTSTDQSFNCQRSAINPNGFAFVRVFARIDANAIPGTKVTLSADANAATPADPFPENEQQLEMTVLANADYIVSSEADLPARNSNPGQCEADTGSSQQICTIRAAIELANSDTTGQVQTLSIGAGNFQLGQTGQFDTGFMGRSIVVTGQMVIAGLGPDVSRIIGPGDDRIFDVRPGASLTLKNVELTGGLSSQAGGAVFAEDASLRLENVTLSNNRSDDLGGAMMIQGDNSSVVVVNSSLINNSALSGGGMALAYAMAQLENVTIVDNSASSMGGGLHFDRAKPSMIKHVTFANNRSDTEIDNISLNSGELSLVNNIIFSSNRNHIRCTGNPTVNNLGGNVLSSSNCNQFTPVDTDVLDQNPRFLSLKSESGGSAAFSIDLDSPAIDTGVAEQCTRFDQRGLTRLQDGDNNGSYICDSGSFEVQAGANLDAPQSGAYFDPARNGEGSFVEILEGGQSALVATFTYQPSGESLAWYVGIGDIVGNSIVVDQMTATEGGVFGADFDASQITNPLVGSTVLSFSDCEASQQPGAYQFSEIGNSGFTDLQTRATRLSSIVSCDGVPTPKSGRSGSFFDVNRSGEGIFVEWLENDQVVLIWYTYDPNGNQFWLISSQADVTGDTAVIEMVYPRELTAYGDNFNADEVMLDRWGTITLEYQPGCNNLVFSYDSELPEFGSGQYQYTRLSRLEGVSCDL